MRCAGGIVRETSASRTMPPYSLSGLIGPLPRAALPDGEYRNPAVSRSRELRAALEARWRRVRRVWHEDETRHRVNSDRVGIVPRRQHGTHSPRRGVDDDEIRRTRVCGTACPTVNNNPAATVPTACGIGVAIRCRVIPYLVSPTGVERGQNGTVRAVQDQHGEQVAYASRPTTDGDIGAGAQGQPRWIAGGKREPLHGRTESVDGGTGAGGHGGRFERGDQACRDDLDFPARIGGRPVVVDEEALRRVVVDARFVAGRAVERPTAPRDGGDEGIRRRVDERGERRVRVIGGDHVDVMVTIEATLVGPGAGSVGETRTRKRADRNARGDREGRGINDPHSVDVRGVDFGCRNGVDAVGTTPSTVRTGAIDRGTGRISTAGEGVGAGALDLR